MRHKKHLRFSNKLLLIFTGSLLLLIFASLEWVQTQTASIITEDTIWADTDIDNTHRVFLPLISKPATWVRVNAQGDSPVNVTTVAFANGSIVAGDGRSGEQGGGIYKGNLLDQAGKYCATATKLSLVNQGSASISRAKFYDFVKNNKTVYRGVAGSYGQKAFYTHPDDPEGNDWQQTQSNIPAVIYSVEKSIIDKEFYAGAGNGIYKSQDWGETWVTISDTMDSVITLVQQGKTLWIGTSSKGIWQLSLQSSNEDTITEYQPQPDNKKIWGFAFYEFGTNKPSFVFIATSSGVYHKNLFDQSQWITTGLQGKEIYALAIAYDHLYAATSNSGAYSIALADLQIGSPPFTWRAEIAGSGWNPNYSVRDLLYVDEENCIGLLAATNDGVWMLR